MERYKRLSEDSLPSLVDATIPGKIKDFIVKNPFPKDDTLHDFADSLGIDVSELEQYVYAFLTLLLTGGESEGKDTDISEENMDIGHRIELEHCSYDSDNEVIVAMQDIIVHKITMDHSFEDKSYYTEGVSFIKELEDEGK